jgi:hypothetical protein
MAWRAARTAASMSAAVPRAISPNFWPSLGSITSMVALPSDATRRPSM